MCVPLGKPEVCEGELGRSVTAQCCPLSGCLLVLVGARLMISECLNWHPERGWAQRQSGRPAVLRTAWGPPPCPAGVKLGGKARQDPCRKMGSNCVILGQVQSYGGQELRAGRWWDLKGLADKLFIALQPVKLCVCFPSAYLGTRGQLVCFI